MARGLKLTMRISSMADYAIVAMRSIALRPAGERMNAAGIAAEAGLPAPTVQKLVSMLAQAGLLLSARGAGGGFCLARPATAITLADIIEAIEGPIAMTGCATEHGDCNRQENCGVRPHWPQANQAVRGALEQITLAQLAQEEVAA
ncbi:SUF system Fe-S cluster assembly regulator [Croceicoccus sp. F390]|uniref:SUF system Fe-S cluster assembly regulator n=1 Tax=Croceicoccus esteveae TaxID=3075597 RepID=A0ABU2ZFS0_9SPHN|nr:SUF system Fe-S cluster assembly regulator [Croceicoccus sp. F390]MDT0575441.1 SUF system Fe-S cluster assembly regulator [Croceicoccus sp. F390]